MNKKNLKKALAPLCLSAIATVGAFAFLSTTDVDTNTHSITAGTFVLDLANEANALNNLKAYPMSDEVGKATAPYTFDLANKGTIDMVTRLSATQVEVVDNQGGHTLLPKDKVRIEIKRVSPVEGAATVYDGLLSEFEGANGSSDVTRIDAGVTAKYELRAWIDKSAVNEDLYGAGQNEVRSIKFNIKVSAMQAEGGLGFSADGKQIEADKQAWEAAAGNVFVGA